MTFRAETRSADGTAILELIGDLNATADAALSAAHEQAVADGPGVLVLQFEQVGYINSTGIALVIGLLARARQERREVRVVGLSEHYRHIFEITRLSDFMTFYDDEGSAVVGAAPATA